MSATLLDRPNFAARYSVSFGDGDRMEVQFAELRSDVRHIQSDVFDIKATVRETNNGLIALREKLEQNGADLNKRIDATGATLNAKFDEIPIRIDGARRELSDKFDGTRTEMVTKIDAMAVRMDNERKELTAQAISVREELGARFDRFAVSTEGGREELYRKLSGDISSSGARLDGRIDDLSRKVDTNHKEVTDKIDRVKTDVWKTRIWMVAVQILVEITLAGTLLGVMARGFHWI